MTNPLPRPHTPKVNTYGRLETTSQKRLQEGGDLPVFDRSRAYHGVAVELRLTVQANHSSHTHFKRTDTDRRPGTPLPPEATGDPRPDRLEHAERIRLALLAKDSRYRIEGSVDRVDVQTARRGPKSSTPDIEKPRSYYIDIPAASAALEARRGGEVLYFMTVTEAARCMTGERKDNWQKAIRNAMGGVTKSAFGWTWTRLRSRQSSRWSR
jgi:hypothetical protein